MALAKTGYSAATVGTSRVNVATDENGYIAVTGTTTATGAKRFQINRVNADNSLDDNTEVLNFFISLANGSADSLSNTMSVTWEV